MKLGIVGHGVLGSAVARTGEWFGMDVLVSQRPGFETTDTTRVPFDQVLGQADVLSLHCPLTEQTSGLIGEKELKRMKTDAFLINTARGGLVDANALVAALENGEIAGAAIDVLENEPPVDGNPLLDYKGENLIVTPHIAWATNEARQNALDEMAANVKAFLDGEERNRVV
jgi:glycerate dehydrogenase